MGPFGGLNSFNDEKKKSLREIVSEPHTHITLNQTRFGANKSFK